MLPEKALTIGMQTSSRPILTVVIPSYNCAQWLDRSIRSTTTLSGCEVQVIVVDDGSTDETPEVLQRLKSEIPSLNILHKQNGGLSSARNYGLAHAHGSYVLLLDADDELIPCDLASLLETGCQMIRIGVEEVSAGKQALIRAESMCMISGREYLSYGFKNHSFYTSSCAYLYKVDWLRQNTLVFEENLLHEDNLFTVQALLKADSILVVPTLLYRYIRRPDSITTDKSDEKLLARVKAYVRIALLLTTIGNQDPSFDLRWKIHEVLDGAQRLAIHCKGLRAQVITLHALLKLIFSYRGYGQHAFRYDQLKRLFKYLRDMLMHH